MKLRYTYLSLLFLFLIFPLFADNEIGINIINPFLLPGKFINSLHKPFFYYYQAWEPHTYITNKATTDISLEIFFIKNRVFRESDFFKISLGNSQIPSSSSLYVSPQNVFHIQWNNHFTYFFTGYGINFKLFSKKFYLQLYGGLGFIPLITFEFHSQEINNNPFSQPNQEFRFYKGKFSSSEGFFYKLSFNFKKNYKNTVLMAGISYWYLISGNFSGKLNSNRTNWFIWNQNHLWITNDIYEYILNKTNYENKNQNIFIPFPPIQNVNPIFYLWDFHFSFAYRIF